MARISGSRARYTTLVSVNADILFIDFSQHLSLQTDVETTEKATYIYVVIA